MIKPVISEDQPEQGSVATYTIGFGLSLLLTLASYLMAQHQLAHGWGLIYALGALAVTQLMVQLIFFLHLGRESKPRWNLTVLLFAFLVVFIVVFGSLWIMKNLSYGHDPSNLTTEQIINDEGYRSSTR